MIKKSEGKDTAVISQYKDIKKNHQDKLLLFHLGDFFEMFYEDAEVVAKTLGLTLTYRKNGDEKIFMCGVPIANKDFYIKKLISHGFKVAICEQVETPLSAKKRGASIVNRSITAIYTAGTFVDAESSDNNYIISIAIFDKKLSCFYFDVSTNDFFYERLKEDDLQNLLHRVNPKEVLLFKRGYNFINLGNFEEVTTYIDVIDLPPTFSNNMEEFMDTCNKEELQALKILFQHLYNTYNSPPVKPPQIGVNSRETTLDKYTIQNLDLFNEKGSLYALLNKNITSMGKRKLREVMLKPLTQQEDIKQRLELVQYFYSNYLLKTQIFTQITNSLQQIGDIQKIIFLLKKKKLHFNLIGNFLRSLEQAENIIQLLKLEGQIPDLIVPIVYSYKFMTTYQELSKIFEENESFFNKDFLRQIYSSHNLEEILAHINTHQEQVKSLIPNAKLSNNSIIGYFFEITNKDRNLMESFGEQFIVKQTLLNNIRFTTKNLIELESSLLFLESKRLEIRNKVMEEFIDRILQEQEIIDNLVQIIATIDLFRGLGVAAVENNYYKPSILPKEHKTLEFKNARHVILEKRRNNFISNNLCMTKKKLTFITGPNMGGKSTFMRTTALVVLMAQIGSFVGAESALISPMNNIFVRIGFNDDSLEGESTFYKEMKECGDILKGCNHPNTLVFFDEICRGTSYEEGIILSKEIIKYLLERNVFVLISSHYLELAKFLLDSYANETNILYTQYIYTEGKLKFLYKIQEGIVDCSFGIKVAEMAGLPEDIIKNALKNYDNI